MAVHAKHYYLFSWRVWSVVIEAEEADDETEVEEEAESYELGTTIIQVNEERPDFGFTPWTPHYLEAEE